MFQWSTNIHLWASAIACWRLPTFWRTQLPHKWKLVDHQREELPIPVLREAWGLRLNQRAGISVPIELSTKDGLAEREHVLGEDMIRADLQHWDQVPQPIHADVVAAVKQALVANDSQKSVRTTHHKEFLQKVAEVPVKPAPGILP